MADFQPQFVVTPSLMFGIPVLNFSGEIDIASAPKFEECLSRANDEKMLIACLQNVEYIDSSGLTALVREHKQRQDRGARFFVITPAGHASRVFQISGLANVLDCFNDLADAIQTARNGAAQAG